jgi:DivIVA domain-containing protein
MDTNETDADEWSKIPHAAPPEDSETALPAFTTTRRGYDQAQVNAYLELVTGRLQDVEAEVSKAARRGPGGAGCCSRGSRRGSSRAPCG